MNKSAVFPIIFLMFIFSGLPGFTAAEDKADSSSFTLLYSNNVHGELEPCG
jgi:hypothetical protein